MLNRDLLTGVTGECQGIRGWAYEKVNDFIGTSFPMGHNPLRTLRRLLPNWEWSIVQVDDLDEESILAYAVGWCGYCGDGKGGGYGEEQVICEWVYNPLVENKVYLIKAIRPTKNLGFACRTSGDEPHWVMVNGREKIGVEGDWNTQARHGSSDPHRFRHFAGLIPDGTKPIPVEQIGETRPWEEGSPYNSGEWGRSGYEIDYQMPDGSKVTRSVTTDEWP